MPRFGDLEAAIMQVVWAQGRPVRVRDVLERVDREPPLAYTTVQTVMDILFRKGWLSRAKEGRANVYEAAASRQDYVSGLMDEALDVAEDRTAALLKFVEGMDPENLSELRRQLDEARARSADAGAEP